MSIGNMEAIAIVQPVTMAGKPVPLHHQVSGRGLLCGVVEDVFPIL